MSEYDLFLFLFYWKLDIRVFISLLNHDQKDTRIMIIEL